MSLPQMRKKDFKQYFRGANPLGNLVVFFIFNFGPVIHQHVYTHTTQLVMLM